MIVTLSNAHEVANMHFDEVVDVRSPSEFLQDHIPGAVNLPVLTDAERAEVGTIYKQVSPFEARKLGAALVAKNAASHLRSHLAEKPGSYRPLVYCWRGGQRSNAFASILSQIGWRADVLSGGYKSYRRLIVEQLYQRSFVGRVVLLDGDTGSGKTDILQRLAASGWQIIDLERMANHRGSVLGGLAQAQPSQKAFESMLARRMADLDPARATIVEAESSKIGAINLPPALWDAMSSAPRLVLDVPREARARYLVHAYRDLNSVDLAERVRQLHRRHGAAQVIAWSDLAASGQTEELAMSLMEKHYDPLYRRARKGNQFKSLALKSSALDPDNIDATVESVSRALKEITPQNSERASQ